VIHLETIEDGLIEVPLIKVDEWRKETFEARLVSMNFADVTRGERIRQVLRLSFDDNGPDLDINGVPDSGMISDIKGYQDFGRLVGYLQAKGLKVKIKEGDSGFTVFHVIPSILGSHVKMEAVPREYQDVDGNQKTATNWRMEIIKLTDTAEEATTKGFVSSPNAPATPTKEDTICVMDDAKALILDILEDAKKENPDKWIPVHEIIKSMRMKFAGQKDAEKYISSYAKLREQALKELVEDCMIEYDGKVLYKIM